MNKSRKPAAFKLEDSPNANQAGKRRVQAKSREPKAVMQMAEVNVTTTEDDPFELEVRSAAADATRPKVKRGLRLGAIFGTAVFLFLSLATGLWVESLIADFFARSEWFGWFASGLIIIAGLALVAIAFREVTALARLRSVAKMQQQASTATSNDDSTEARKLIAELSAFTRSNPRTSKGRETLQSLNNEVIDGADLVKIAERELFGGLDEEAKDMILQSAKRVSVITAVSPRALIDVAFVLFESGRLIRRISELYGGRPGFFGFTRLVRNVAAHLAITGSIAVGDSLVQQVVGHGLAAKLSTRLGEGVVNGMMTVRIGIAAMETARPLPFNALKRPGIGQFLSALTGSIASKNGD